jgi:formylmethanofuran--tetrahydromethanopterin N-formyltransferase
MRVGIEAATTVAGVKEIHTANYGGRLGKGKIQLHSLFD